MARPGSAAPFDLDETERSPFFGDDVDLSGRRAEVPLEDAEPLAAENADGERLAPITHAPGAGETTAVAPFGLPHAAHNRRDRGGDSRKHGRIMPRPSPSRRGKMSMASEALASLDFSPQAIQR